MDMDERWVKRSAQTMLESFHWFQREGFGLIVEDLLRLPAGTGVIVEGFRLLPYLVKPLLAQPRHAVWLLPTPEFRRAAFERRGWQIPSKTSDPELGGAQPARSATGCSPTASSRRPSTSNCPPSRSTPRWTRATWSGR